jgi:hypothetical protein
MPVFQFTQHVCEYFKELFSVEPLSRAYIIFIIYGVPVETIFMLFVVEETVVFVNNFPECLEVSFGSVGKLLLVDAREE